LLEALPSSDREATRELRASFAKVVEQSHPHTIPLLRYPLAEDDENVDRFWTVTNSPLFDCQGNLRGILNSPIEVTRLLASSDGAAPAARAGKDEMPGIDATAINQHLEREQRRFRQLMQQAPGFVAVGHGPDHVFELANNAYYQLVGHREILGKPVRQALPELAGQGFYELLDDVYRNGQPFIGRAMPIQLQSEPDAPLVERYIDFIYQPIFDEDGKVSGIFVQGHDVTEAHELSRKVSYQAAHDSLTGLFSRREFERRLMNAVEEVDMGMGVHSLIYLDLDQFKVVNDTSGHAAGDELLRQVSMKLLSVTSPDDTVARLGGDEFGILLRGADARAARAMAERLRQTIDGIDFSWDLRIFICSASLGVVTLGTDMGGATDVLSAADSACFMAKERGRNRVQVHCQHDGDIVLRRREMDWISRLKVAMAENRLSLYAQRILPTCRQSNDPLVRMELLLRLHDTDGALVPPMAFIPAAERFGLMPLLDRFVIDEALAALSAMPVSVRGGLDISINLSGHTLSDERFLPHLRERLEVDRSLASRICFEVTETAALQNMSRTADMMVELKAMGFRFALDDFGSGMSSLRYLKQLPVDSLKIDGAFIKQITTNPADAAMVEAMAKVASVMGIRTVAEFVDSEATRDMLERLDIDYVQGYHVHVPEPFTNLIEAYTTS
jgi:diguanylate cyclase (GGDEF)-like protein